MVTYITGCYAAIVRGLTCCKILARHWALRKIWSTKFPWGGKPYPASGLFGFGLNKSMQHPFWSPHLKLQINQIEKVQRTAARWTCMRWWNTSSDGEMLDELEWHLLRPGGTSSPCSSFARFIVEQCLL